MKEPTNPIMDAHEDTIMNTLYSETQKVHSNAMKELVKLDDWHCTVPYFGRWYSRLCSWLSGAYAVDIMHRLLVDGDRSLNLYFSMLVWVTLLIGIFSRELGEILVKKFDRHKESAIEEWTKVAECSSVILSNIEKYRNK